MLKAAKPAAASTRRIAAKYRQAAGASRTL